MRKLVHRRHTRDLVTRHVTLPDRRAGVRIVLASDLHARDDWYGRGSVAAAVDAINQVPDVDLVAMPGDFVGDDTSSMAWAGPLLGEVEAPVVATLGNHDHWAGALDVITALEAAGIRVLLNESFELRAGVYVAGIDSTWGGNPDAVVALREVPDDAVAVVLGHEPVLATRHDAWLHLAGHTHHGQIRPPLVGELVASRCYPRHSRPWPKGLAEPAPGRHIYTSGGLGFSVLPLRVGCPPEIVVIDA